MSNLAFQQLRTWFVIHGAQALPGLVKVLRPFRRPSIVAYKEDHFWYVRDFNGFSKAANQLVCGVPEFLEHHAGADASQVRLKYSDRPLAGAQVLTLIETDPWGSTYQWFDGQATRQAWLCPVSFWYFRSAPQQLYVLVERF